MTDDWFWRPDRLPEKRTVVPYTPMPALTAGAAVPQLNLADLDASFQLAVQALNAMLATAGRAAGAALYDPRLEVLRAYFIACSRGDISLAELALAVRVEVFGMGDNPIAAILGFELAKAGFVSLGWPRLAAPFAREAARGRLYLHRFSLARQTQLEETTNATRFDWQE